MKNKSALIISVVVLAVVLIGGFLVIKNLTQPVAPVIEEEEEVSNLPPADPSIVVNVTPKSDGKAVIMTIAKIPLGTQSIEYEFNYTTGEGLPKGTIGKIDVNGKSELEREILLGTCSKNKCTYDTGVTSVNVVLRFNHPDGATQLSKDFSLE